MIGETIGNFKVTKRVGVGGMGEVWLAEQQNIGTHVAIKLLGAAISQDTEHVQRFFNEARAVSRIQHAGIVKIFDVGTHAGQAYLIMEYLEGETLSQRLKRGSLRFGEIGEIGRQIASVLDATHTAGITHRDLKPDNIFLVPDRELGERVKVLDFGIAKLTGTLAGASPRTMGTMGTPAYMAPEQWGDTSKVDWRADLYSLGCVAFEMTCGRVPFVATTIAEACGKHLNEEPPKASSLAPAVPAALEQLIAQLLEKEPAARPKSMREVAAAFALVDKQAMGSAPTLTTAPVSLPLPTGARKRSMRPASVLLGVLALGAGAAGAVYFFQADSSTPVEGDAAVTAAAPDEESAAPPAPPSHAKPTQPSSTPSSSTGAAQPAGVDPRNPPTASPSAAADATPRPQTADARAPVETDARTPASDARTPASDARLAPAADARLAPTTATPSAPTDAGLRTPTSDARVATAKQPKPTSPPAEGADAEALQQAVRARSAQMNRCYEVALQDNPSLSGTVTLQIKIDANGRVTTATADGLSEGIQTCLIAQIREIKFPKPHDPPVSLLIPFRFERE
ncbi:MAG TPA: protein kinase [Kofleriaceae bacterium]